MARQQIEIALPLLLRRIWPYLDELDEQDSAGAIGAVQEATMTLGEAARHLDTTVDALRALIYDGLYDGRLPATPDASTGGCW